MKHYIVGYNESWGQDRTNIIVGSFTARTRALGIVTELEQENQELYQGLRSVYMVELESNIKKTINVPILDWTDAYTTIRATTENGAVVIN